MSDSRFPKTLTGLPRAAAVPDRCGLTSPSGLARQDRRLSHDGRVPSPHVADLIAKIKESVEQMARQRTSRGDLKILSRTLRELGHAFKVFTPYRGCRKVTVFGSARTPPEAGAYQQAVKLGRAMAHQGWLVVTGAASGIMEAGHVGAGREKSMGLNIILPFEQAANPIIAGDRKLVYMKYFFTRKLMFVKESHAICLLPGGFGTLDEGLEVLTLLQTGKRDMMPVVLLDEPGGDFWSELASFIEKRLVARGMIAPEDVALYKRTDRVEEAVAEILGFYRVYQSMRQVRGRLVLRLARPLDREPFDEIHRKFADLLADGRFVQCGPLPEERDEPELADQPRLVFAFNHRSFGRLRQLIDFVNGSGQGS